jgi:methylase of polypeptide subunit release factors
MADLVRDPLPADGPIRFAEPACGAGAQILAFAKSLPTKDLSRLRVQAVDVSRVACDLCLINTTLWNIPTVVIHGNTLSLEQWGAWANWPMIQAAPITCRSLMKLDPSNAKPHPGRDGADHGTTA